jgi:uncharacterized protein HemX
MSDDMDDHSDAGLVAWLKNQYGRHKEIEDKLAAERIESLSAELASVKQYSAFVDKEIAFRKEQLEAAERSAAALREQVIEECAKVCDVRAARLHRDDWNGLAVTAEECAQSIRALKP